MKRRLLVAVLIAVPLALVGSLLFRGAPEGPGSGDLGERADVEGAPSDPVLRPSPARDAPDAADASAAGPETPAAGTAPDEPSPVAVLRVRVEAPGDIGETPVKVRLEWETAARGGRSCARWHEVGASATEIPIDHLLRLKDVAQVRMTTHHPDFIDTVEVVTLEDRDREIVLTLRRACLVTGRAIRPNRTIFSSLSVALYEMGPGAPIHNERYRWATPNVDSVYTGVPDGRFRLKAAEPGEYLLVAGQRGHAPVGRRVTLEEGAPLDVGDIEVGTGVAISGSLMFRGEPVSGARVGARSLAEGAWFLASGEVVWDGAELRAGTTEAGTDAEGNFTLAGLHPGPHLLLIREWPIRGQSMSHVMIDLGEVSAPQDGLRLELRAFVLEIRTVAEGRPVPRSRVLIMPVDGGHVTTVDTDAKGKGTALLPPDSRYLAWVEGSEYAGERMELETGAVGATDLLEVPVVRKPKLGVLTLRLLNAARRPITAAFIRCTSATGGHRVEIGHPRAEGGVFRVDLPVAGTWHVRVLPGVHSTHWGPGSFYQAVETTVDIAEGAEIDQTLVAPIGGRILLDVRDTDGDYLSAEVRVRDERGALLEDFTWRIAGPRMTFGNASELLGMGPATGNDVLAPGRYEITLDVKEHEVVERAVVVRPRATTRVEVRLPAR